MPEYDDTNRGVLFKNQRKETEKHPDYTGSLNVGGVEHFLDAWIKTSSKDGSKFMSVSVKPKQARQETARQPDTRGGSSYDDDLPFAPEWR